MCVHVCTHTCARILTRRGREIGKREGGREGRQSAVWGLARPTSSSRSPATWHGITNFSRPVADTNVSRAYLDYTEKGSAADLNRSPGRTRRGGDILHPPTAAPPTWMDDLIGVKPLRQTRNLEPGVRSCNPLLSNIHFLKWRLLKS